MLSQTVLFCKKSGDLLPRDIPFWRLYFMIWPKINGHQIKFVGRLYNISLLVLSASAVIHLWLTYVTKWPVKWILKRKWERLETQAIFADNQTLQNNKKLETISNRRSREKYKITIVFSKLESKIFGECYARNNYGKCVRPSKMIVLPDLSLQNWNLKILVKYFKKVFLKILKSYYWIVGLC